MSKVTLEFLQDLFHKVYPDVAIKNFEESPASERGDNYTASLYRICLNGTKVDGSKWSKRIIYKCLPENPIRREAFRSEKLFKNEVIFYTKVLPALMQYQATRKVTHEFKAVPRCFYARDDVIILDDLCELGFRMANRKLGLNVQQITAILKELAYFHALSLALKTTAPDKFFALIGSDGIREVLFTPENDEWYRDYYQLAKKNALAMVEMGIHENKLDEMYVEKFMRFLDDGFFKRMIEMASGFSPLAVLCHGDCWTNNFFFKTQEASDTQVYFIDFQLCRYGSLALDLVNLIYCCTTRYIRDNNLGAFLELYENHLHTSLNELLSIKVEYTNKNVLCSLVHDEFRRCASFGLGLAIDIVPISTCESDEAPDLYLSEDDSDNNAQMLTTNEVCKTKMVNLVTELVDYGIL